MKLVSVAQMRAIEQEADARGVSYETMMENAGCGLAEFIHTAGGQNGWEQAAGIVGPGNNGGDTLVALTWLVEAGWQTHAFLFKRSPMGDPLVSRLMEAGGEVTEVVTDEGFERLKSTLGISDVVLDGLLGSGFRLPLKPAFAEFLKQLHILHSSMEEPPTVVAVDCPSGVDCDTGEMAAEVLPADWTITMAAVKQGLLKIPAYSKIGQLKVVDIGLPGDLSAFADLFIDVADDEMIASILPVRNLDSHKGTFGTAMVAAGSVNYTGAALLAGKAACRVGAGLVTLAVIQPLHAALSGQLPEVTWVILPQDSGSISENAAEVLTGYLDRATALLVGPGVGNSNSTGRFVDKIISTVNLPLVIDADGLRHLAGIPGWSNKPAQTAILTPHPGEMSFMTGLSREEIQLNRQETARKFAVEWGHVVVLKGAFTVVASPNGNATIIPVATPALARAGTGDVLAGLIVGLRAQGLDAYQAAVAGSYIHAQAGLAAVGARGDSASVMAGDLLDMIGWVIADLK